MTEPDKTVAVNRKARHDYQIEETYEAGLVLTGTEIKSVRVHRVQLRDSYAVIKDGEAWLINTHIAPYQGIRHQEHDPRRTRKLLLHRHQINRLASKVQERGYTLVPLKMYLTRNRAKVEIGLARGKKQYDKRATIAARETKRQIERTLKGQRCER